MGIKWIKLSTGLVADSKIRYIRGCKNGDQMALLWVMLLCRAGVVNDGGRVYVAPGVPYDAAHMADEFGLPVRVVSEALKLFEQLGMVTVDGDGALVITRWNDHQNVDGMERARDAARERSARYRANKRDASRDGNVTQRERDVTVTPQNKKEEREEEGEFQKNLGMPDWISGGFPIRFTSRAAPTPLPRGGCGCMTSIGRTRRPTSTCSGI